MAHTILDRSLSRHLTGALVSAVLALGLGAPLRAQTQDLNAAYSKSSFMVPMRDGVRLFTQVFEPKDRSRPYPILLFRTPYGVRHPEEHITRSKLGPSEHFDRAGYIFAYQDVRGQFESEGEWEVLAPPRSDPTDPLAADETTDAFDTIDWLLRNREGHNSRVGMWGISYPAWETVMAMADAHPALVAVSPQASPADMFVGDDIHHHGAFRLSYIYAWMAAMAAYSGDVTRAQSGLARATDAYAFFLELGPLANINKRLLKGKVSAWNDLMEHGTYDEHWRQRNALSVLGDVRPAVLNVAGWFDAEDFRGPLDIYAKVEEKDEQDRNFLAVGPWSHGGWNGKSGESLGALRFETPTAYTFQEEVEFPFFEHHLRDGPDPLLPEVIAFETGGNAWRKLAQWPVESAKPRALYLRAQGRAAFDPPRADEGHSEFVSDPADPVPFTREGGLAPGHLYMIEDQRFVAERPDVLVFESEPLDEDLVIAGRIEVVLHFTTTGTDADWVVQVIDAYPDEGETADGGELSESKEMPDDKALNGYRLPLSADIFRAKFRNSYESPTALVPGETTELRFHLPDRLHRFRKGHRILIQLHSTWFPLYDRNPQTFGDIYSAGTEDFRKATHRVLHAEDKASHLVLPVLQD